MKIIKKGHQIKKILGCQTSRDGASLRLFAYCVVAPADESFLIYNIVTKEMILLDAEEYSTISSDDSDCSLRQYLYDNWFLVPHNHDDKKLALDIRSLASVMYAPELLSSYTVVTTMDCNARCFYCYEHGCEKTSMSRQTALDVVKFIESTCGGEKVFLHWFGGEPLFNSEVIDVISDGLSAHGIPFASRMTSNGYLFTEELIEKAVNDWHLNSVQITLDGTEDIYNKRKAYVNNSGSAFVRVTNNIERLLVSGVTINLRMNVDRENVGDLIKLCDYVSDRYEKYENFYVSVKHISDGKSDNPLRGTAEDAYADLRRLKEYIRSKGIKQYRTDSLDKIHTNYCMADSDSAIVIAPNGDLRECQHVYWAKTCGSIYRGITDEEVVNEWKVTDEPGSECDTCPLFPNCIMLQCCPSAHKCEPYMREDKLNRLKEEIVDYYKSTLK